MARSYDTRIFGEDYVFNLTPDVLAYEMSMDFSDQIIIRCDETDTTLGQLADILGISPSTLSEKLNGQNMTLKSIAALALALDCDVKGPQLIPLEASMMHQSNLESSSYEWMAKSPRIDFSEENDAINIISSETAYDTIDNPAFSSYGIKHKAHYKPSDCLKRAA